jgi:hypothetical protein
VPFTVIGFEEKPIPMLCARLYGFSVRDCACKLAAGGWLECPERARGVLEPIEEFNARVAASQPIQKVNALADNSGFARSALRAVKAATTGDGLPKVAPLQWYTGPVPAAARAAVTDIEPEPTTPQQIRAAVAAERATLPIVRSTLHNPQTDMPIGGREMGFTGNICGNCQSTRMVRNGVCETCLDCFHSGECG